MKQIALYALLQVSGISCFMSSNDQTHTAGTAIHLLIDVTDKKHVWPTPEPTLALFNCKQVPEAECRFRASVITDKQQNPSYACRLADMPTTERENADGNPQHRNRAITAFYADVRNRFQALYEQFDTAQSLGNSEIWMAVCAELRRLAAIPCQRKYFILYSDLQERSDIYDSYKAAVPDIQTIEDRFEKSGQMPASLAGIHVIIVYQPATRTEDRQFNAMLAIYRCCLEKRGAQVIAQAGNTNYEP